MKRELFFPARFVKPTKHLHLFSAALHARTNVLPLRRRRKKRNTPPSDANRSSVFCSLRLPLNELTTSCDRLLIASQCWCAVGPMLTKNGEMLALDECDMECEGTTSDEFCGGTNKITAYRIDGVVSPFMGCYVDDRDARALNMEGKYVSEDMTNKVRGARSTFVYNLEVSSPSF